MRKKTAEAALARAAAEAANPLLFESLPYAPKHLRHVELRLLAAIHPTDTRIKPCDEARCLSLQRRGLVKIRRIRDLAGGMVLYAHQTAEGAAALAAR